MKTHDQWHPKYQTFSEWLTAEGGPPDLNIARPAKPDRRRRMLRLHKPRPS